MTDPARSAVLVDVTFESLTARPYQVYRLYDTARSNTGENDHGEQAGDALLASDDHNASALMTEPRFAKTSSGYLGTSDGWTDLRDDHRMDRTYGSAPQPGNVVQTAQTALTGLRGNQHMTLVLGFGPTQDAAAYTAAGALTGGFKTAAKSYAAGWHDISAGCGAHAAWRDSSGTTTRP